VAVDFFLPTSIDKVAITAAAAKETVENTFAIQKPSAAIDSQNINTCSRLNSTGKFFLTTN